MQDDYLSSYIFTDVITDKQFFYYIVSAAFKQLYI